MSSYPKVYNVGHPALDGFFDDVVTVEEKIDGSQFSFWRDDDGLHFRSKRADIYQEAAGMFEAGVQDIVRLYKQSPLTIKHDFVYRAEYLQKPKHNALAYDRVPNGHVILFDIMVDPERYASREMLEDEASDLSLEVVPVLLEGKINSAKDVEDLLQTESILGGQKVEGLVFKRRGNAIFGRDAKPLIAKYVSEAYREVHQKKKYKVPRQEIINSIIEQYRVEPRWLKAVQHLRDDGVLEQSPRDIGKLIVEIQEDLKAECGEEIRKTLYNHFIGDILRGSIRGMPEWYKEQLLQLQFKEDK